MQDVKVGEYWGTIENGDIMQITAIDNNMVYYTYTDDDSIYDIHLEIIKSSFILKRGYNSELYKVLNP